jgi:hypothetical protein
MPAPLISFSRDVSWSNKHQNVHARVERLYDVWNRWADHSRPTTRVWEAGLNALQQIVRDAEQAGKHVRALGGAWSLSAAALSEDFLVNTKPLNYLELGLRPESVEPSYASHCTRLVFAQCGVSVMELNQFLEAQGLALPTSGASNGQTICGAISTGTHGSANSLGSMQDFILGLHVVAEGGKHYFIERASNPVVSDAFCAILGCTRLRDDELFDAALVGFGSFGLIHAVLFMAEPLYLIERHIQRYDFARVQPVLSTLDVSGLGLPDGAALPFHFEVVLNPYGTAAGARGAFVRALYKRPYRPLPPAGPGATVVSSPGDDLLSLLGRITGAVPEVIPLAVDELISAQVHELSSAFATPGHTFGPTDIQGQVMSTEIGIALADAGRAVDAILAVANDFPFAGLMGIRFVKASQAHLAFTHFAPTTCTIEIPCAGSARTQEAFEHIWDTLEQRGITYTQHWGQCLRYDPERVRRAFGDRVDRWLRARRSFLSAAGRRTFANRLLQSAGLAD